MDEQLDNELVVNNDVPETSEEILEDVQVGASENEEQIQENTQEVETPSQEDIERQIEERANKRFEEKVEERLIRDRNTRERKQNQELAKYRQLESIIKAGVGADNLDDAISKTSEFYKEQGIDIPDIKESYNERDEKILAKADAQEIIELGRNEIELEANRIASIPFEKRTTREKAIFDTLCKELISLKDVDDLKEKGYKTEILQTKEFNEFRNQFNTNTPISKIYEMYNKLNEKPVEKPASAGSAKSENRQVAETFTPEKINSMTPQEISKYWNNPAFRKVAGLN